MGQGQRPQHGDGNSSLGWCLILLVLSPAMAGCDAEGRDGDAQPTGPGARGPEGPPGPPGERGEDGARRIYGDGRVGSRVVDEEMALADISAGPALHFVDLVIEPDGVLVVPSGATIRCTGEFTNRGTIVVERGAVPGVTATNSEFGVGPIRPAGRGMSLAPPGLPLMHPNTSGGSHGGFGIDEGAKFVLHAERLAGGAGVHRLAFGGGYGGGGLTVIAEGAVTNSGVINARGGDAESPGASGGAGGFVVLVSGAVVNLDGGLVDLRGGDGGTSGIISGNYAVGPGGGGGGGCLRLLGPRFDLTIDSYATAGGVGGAKLDILGATAAMGGPGGGAMCGNGGRGGDATVVGVVTAAGDGTRGSVFTDLADPVGAL